MQMRVASDVLPGRRGRIPAARFMARLAFLLAPAILSHTLAPFTTPIVVV